MSDAVYSTKVSATGGRHGSIRSDDGLFNLKLALPRTLGGKGDATNPERLFAGGYASSFQNALFHVSREARRHFADCDIEVVAQIGLMVRPYKGITGVHGREDSRPRGRGSCNRIKPKYRSYERRRPGRPDRGGDAR